MGKKADLTWLSTLNCVKFSLDYNDHKPSLTTLQELTGLPEAYVDLSEDEKTQIATADSLWSLTIYRDPVKSHAAFYAATLEGVIAKAREHFNLLEWQKKLETIAATPEKCPNHS